MEIRITHDTKNSPVWLWLNGQLAAEIAVGSLTGDQGSLLAEVVRARRLEAIPRMIRSLWKDLQRARDTPSEGLKPEQKLDDWVMGFEDGLVLLEVPVPQPPPLPQSARPSQLVHIHSGKTQRGTTAFSFAYKQGYCWGETLRKFCDAVVAEGAKT